MGFPAMRLRRLRRTPALRELVAETHLKPADFIMPYFVSDAPDFRQPISSMPGIDQMSIDFMVKEVESLLDKGIRSVMLFGIPDGKDPQATTAYQQGGVIQQAIEQLKDHYGDDVVVMADTCLCEYTSHGHCGIVMEGRVVNDPSVEVLVKTALSQARAGADMVCPSDMMDGRIQAIREALDEEGFSDTLIMSYAVKYASSFYAPFRDAAESAPAFGDRRSYQMDPRNAREALREADLDLDEGADLLMVKPAIGYLDILHRVRRNCDLPLVAYNVSGEYSMVKAAAEKGWIDEKQVVLELLTGIKRAGADLIATYHARDAAQWLQEL